MQFPDTKNRNSSKAYFRRNKSMPTGNYRMVGCWESINCWLALVVGFPSQSKRDKPRSEQQRRPGIEMNTNHVAVKFYSACSCIPLYHRMVPHANPFYIWNTFDEKWSWVSMYYAAWLYKPQILYSFPSISHLSDPYIVSMHWFGGRDTPCIPQFTNNWWLWTQFGTCWELLEILVETRNL